MALILLQPGIEPLGQFDLLSGQSYLGGEVVQFTTVATTVAGPADDLDGYIGGSLGGLGGTAGTTKPVLTRVLVPERRPLYLSDDGTANYGTLLGAVLGGVAGTQINNPGLSTYTGAILGPASYVGSGRLTVWGKPGTYGVTLDACDTNATLGLQPTNPTLVPNAPLFATVSNYTAPGSGVLTPNAVQSFEGGGTFGLVVGYFIEFRTKGSLVSTPNRLVSALNSPSSVIGGVLSSTQFMAVFEWVGVASANYYSTSTGGFGTVGTAGLATGMSGV